MDVYEATDCMLVAQLDRVGLVRQLEMLVLLRCRKRYFVRASVQHLEKSRTSADSKPDLPQVQFAPEASSMLLSFSSW